MGGAGGAEGGTVGREMGRTAAGACGATGATTGGVLSVGGWGITYPPTTFGSGGASGQFAAGGKSFEDNDCSCDKPRYWAGGIGGLDGPPVKGGGWLPENGIVPPVGPGAALPEFFILELSTKSEYFEGKQVPETN